MNEKAAVRNRLGLISEQSLYNLIERRAELEVIPAALEYGLSVISWSPLAGGLLSLDSGEDGGRRWSDAIKTAREARQDQLTRFSQVCAEIGGAPSAVALAWTLHQAGIAATIIGPSNKEQLTSIAHVPDIVLNADILLKIDTIFPPCGSAPEAYAW
jgi:aryl-alcohol dehydrogenase-like predicted oxidoreductase